jgi:hypothetical protein
LLEGHLAFFRLLVIITRKHLPRKRSEEKDQSLCAPPFRLNRKNIRRNAPPYPSAEGGKAQNPRTICHALAEIHDTGSKMEQTNKQTYMHAAQENATRKNSGNSNQTEGIRCKQSRDVKATGLSKST